MNQDHRIGPVMVAVCGVWLAVAAQPSVAARPSGGDVKPPGQVSSVTPLRAERGIALGFLATGDDGSSGTATGYDTQIWQASSCAAGDAPAYWVPSGIVPRPAGAFDAIGWSDLGAATDYCVRFRVLDEAGNFTLQGPYAARTLENAGDWAFTGISGIHLPNPAVASVIDDDQSADPLVVVFGATDVRIARVPVIQGDGSNLTTISEANLDSAGNCTGPEVTCLETLAAGSGELSGFSGIDWQFPTSMGVAGVPGDGLVGVIMRGIRAGTAEKVPLFAERTASGWTVEALPFDPSRGNQGSAGLIYIDGKAITTWVAEAANSATLYVAERSVDAQTGLGVWNSTPLITRTRTKKTAALPGFSSRSLVETSGRLGIWVSVAPDGAGGIANGVHLVRCNPVDADCRDSSGTRHDWIWYDTGRPTGVDIASSGWFSFSDLAAIGPDGKLRVIDRAGSSPVTLQTLHQDAFGPPSFGLAGAGSATGVRPWQTLFSVPTVLNQAPPIRLTGVTFSGCGYHVGYTLGYGTLFQQQNVLHVRAASSSPEIEPVTFTDVTVDLTDKRLTTAIDGDLVLAMRAIRRERNEFTLARRSVGLCP